MKLANLKTLISNPKELRLLSRFALQGIFFSFACLGMFYVLITFFHLHYLIAHNITVVLGVVLSFLTNKYLVFKDTSRQVVIQGSRYFLVQGSLHIFANFLLFCLVGLANFDKMLSAIINGIVYSSLNFILLRFGVFGRRENDAG